MDRLELDYVDGKPRHVLRITDDGEEFAGLVDPLKSNVDIGKFGKVPTVNEGAPLVYPGWPIVGRNVTDDSIEVPPGLREPADQITIAPAASLREVSAHALDLLRREVRIHARILHLTARPRYPPSRSVALKTAEPFIIFLISLGLDMDDDVIDLGHLFLDSILDGDCDLVPGRYCDIGSDFDIEVDDV